MTARVLVVDDVPANLKLLEARLTAEYFEVVTAAGGDEALRICAEGGCDIVLLDVMMPGMDGFEVCRELKSNRATSHIPVVMVTALDQASDRVKGLEAGADDFLTKPIDEIALLARVRSLARLRLVLDELRARAMRSARLGISSVFSTAIADNGAGGRILLVDDRAASAQKIKLALSAAHDVDLEPDAPAALRKGMEGGYDLFVVSLGLADYDALRLCSQIRSCEQTRQIPVLAIAEAEDRRRILHGLDIGVNDYVMRPIDRNELFARIRTQIRRKRYADCLRGDLDTSVEMAVVDPLTKLKNRRYFESKLASLLADARRQARPLCVMMIDIDHFKQINDRYGHPSGDRLLKLFAARARAAMRDGDVLCRLSGDEFVAILPDAGLRAGELVAERVRTAIGAHGFKLAAGQTPAPVTVSIGLAESAGDCAPDLIGRADAALYRSKQRGRNLVCLDEFERQSGAA